MSIAPCPHCYRKIIPMTDGTCPSCGKNTNDRAATDPHKTIIGIKPSDRLPPVCFHCGAPTQRTKRLSLSSEPQGTTFGGGFARFLALLFKPFAFIDSMERMSKTVEISMRLPVCPQCWKGLRRITPEYIDFDDHRVDLVVHQQFKIALKIYASA